MNTIDRTFIDLAIFTAVLLAYTHGLPLVRAAYKKVRDSHDVEAMLAKVVDEEDRAKADAKTVEATAALDFDRMKAEVMGEGQKMVAAVAEAKAAVEDTSKVVLQAVEKAA